MGFDGTTAMLAYQTRKKETLVAYILWWFLGTFGAHRFYCNRVGSGVAMLVIALVSLPLCFIFVGFISLFGVWVWWLVDAFLVAGWVQSHNQFLANQIESARHALPERSTSGTHPPELRS